MPKPKCVHCKRRAAASPRGLCGYCYNQLDVRELYPRRFKTGADPSMEELDRLVAERSRPENLPSWWDEDNKKLNGRI